MQAQRPRSFDTLADLVLRAVELVPPRFVVSYGDLAELVGTAPRVVGAVLARYGHETAWWRVTDRAGRLPAGLLEEARLRWREESIGYTETGCRIDQHRADLSALAKRWEGSAEA